VEEVGGGTLDMINQCREWGFPEPLFEHISGAFVVTFRLPPAVDDLKKGSINNKEYITLNNISRKTATTDLKQLVLKGLLTRVGEGKRNIQYVLPDYAKNTQKGS
jgi:ATP-dependent DNA helicase RecG